jgi:hypothetical protein
MPRLALDSLAQVLTEAGNAHHHYEQGFLNGKRDEQWSGFYSAYALGRLGDFVSPSALSQWLEEAPAHDSWSTSTAAHVLERLAE